MLENISKIKVQLIIIPMLILNLGCKNKEFDEKINFNQQIWLTGDRTIRGKMIDNIIKDSILIGKSKSEVLFLLGAEGDTTQNLSYEIDLGYKTGPFGIGGNWIFSLNVHFDTLSDRVNWVMCND